MNNPAQESRPPRVAVFPWGGVAEDYLAPIGVDRRMFAEEMTGGWLFGFAEALRTQNVSTSILYFSSDVNQPERHVNPSTGVATLYLPCSRLYRRLRRWPGDSDDVYRLGHAGLPAWAAPAQDLVRYFATAPAAVAAGLRAEGCTAILTQEYENPRFDVLAYLGRRLGLPLFATFQGAPPPTNAFERTIRRRTMRCAAGFIVASAVEATRLAGTYGIPAERIARLPNPLDLDLWRPEPRAACRHRLGVPESAQVVVCHGRIELHRKGLDLLLEAWRRLAAAHPAGDLRLHLIGSGKDDAALAEAIGRSPVPGLRWVRCYVNDRDEMRRELSAADAYVLPSRHEGFPVAPLEALACGLPVLAADVPGIRDIFPTGEAEGGIVVPTGSVDALQHGLERLLFEPGLRRRLAEAARPRVAEFCALEVVGEQLARLLATHRGGQR